MELGWNSGCRLSSKMDLSFERDFLTWSGGNSFFVKNSILKRQLRNRLGTEENSVTFWKWGTSKRGILKSFVSPGYSLLRLGNNTTSYIKRQLTLESPEFRAVLAACRVICRKEEKQNTPVRIQTSHISEYTKV